MFTSNTTITNGNVKRKTNVKRQYCIEQNKLWNVRNPLAPYLFYKGKEASCNSHGWQIFCRSFLIINHFFYITLHYITLHTCKIKKNENVKIMEKGEHESTLVTPGHSGTYT